MQHHTSAEGGADAAAQALADALIAGNLPAPDLDDVARLELAWLLKARCYAAWSSAPETTGAIAQASRRLTAPHGPLAAVEALADWTEGIAAIVRADLAAALDALERSARAWRALGEPKHEAQTNVPQIAALAMLGRFDDAAARGDAARVALEAAGDTPGAARVSLNLGSLALQRDRYADALPHYRAAAALFARAGDSEHSVMADLGLANALDLLGDVDEAALILDRAGTRARHHGLAVLEATAQLHRAHIDQTRGAFAAALAGFETSRRAFDHLGLPGSRLEAEKSLADAYLELNLLSEADALFSRLDQALTGDMATKPKVALQWARVAASSGRYEEALARLEHATRTFATQRNEIGTAQVELVRAQVHLAMGDARRAGQGAAAAADTFARLDVAYLEAAARVTQADALLAAGDAQAAVMLCERVIVDAGPQARVRALSVQGDALLALGQPLRARPVFEAAIDAFEALRARVPGDELRRAFLADVLRPYRRRLQAALDDAEAGAGSATEAFGWLERFKSRTLAERELGRVDHPHDPVLRRRLDWLYRSQQRAIDDNRESNPALAIEIARLESELLETWRRERMLTGAADVTHVAAPAGHPMQGLQPHDAIVEYGVVADELFAFVVDAGEITLHRRLASWREVVRMVQGLRFQIETARAGAGVIAVHRSLLAERSRARLRALHAAIWAPLAPRVAPCPRLVIVPHGVLHAMPFAALDDGNGALIDRHDICVAPSAAAIVQRAPAQGRAALLLGDSDRLAHAAAEIDAVAAAWPGAQQRLGREAACKALTDAAPTAGLLHIACHAGFRPDNPRFSWMQLADGRIAACDVERWQLPSSTVVLSGCETAVSDPDAGDETLGLVRAFLQAGAARVVGSLWPVEDGATAELMSQFHQALAAGRGAAAALRAAQCEVRVSRPDPFHWAGFMVHGGL